METINFLVCFSLQFLAEFDEISCDQSHYSFMQGVQFERIYAALPLNFTAVVRYYRLQAVPPFRRSPSYESKKGNEKNFDLKELHGARWNPCGVLTSTFLFYFRALFGRRRKGRTARRLTILSLWHPRYATKKKKRKKDPCVPHWADWQTYGYLLTVKVSLWIQVTI